MPCPISWQEHIISCYGNTESKDRIALSNGYLGMLRFLSVSSSTKDRILQILYPIILANLNSAGTSDLQTLLALGVYLEVTLAESPSLIPNIWPQLCRSAVRLGHMPLYLENLMTYCEKHTVDLTVDASHDLIEILIRNLSSSSHVLRKLSLRILKALYILEHHCEADALALALIIEESPLDLQSARAVSMYVRKLANLYQKVSSDTWLSKIIPHYCFGLFTFKLSQIWDDAVITLAEICKTSVGEEIVSGLVFEWLEDLESMNAESSRILEENKNKISTMDAFKCSNLMQLEAIADSKEQELAKARDFLEEHFDAKHQTLSVRVPGAHLHALRILKGVPHIAEKRSRRLVPLALHWFTSGNDDASSIDVTRVVSIDSVVLDEATKLNFRSSSGRDRKAMLQLFGCFQNPRVLYRSHDVLESLRELLTNGDTEIQRLSLAAIFTWKLQGLQPYKDNLLNILDDARFREEISVFVHVDDQDSVIQDGHRPELMPVLLRLLYGKMISKAGVADGAKGQQAKRKAVLQALSRFSIGDLGQFIQIILGPLKELDSLADPQNNAALLSDQLSPRKQIGLITMMKDMLETLGNRLAIFANKLINSLLYCVIRAARNLSIISSDSNREREQNSATSIQKSIRQAGLQCLNLLFQKSPSTELQSFLPIIFAELISPRLEALPVETAQSVSGMLQLFSTWASSQEMVLYLAEYNSQVLRAIVSCLNVPSAKDVVKLFVIEDILQRAILIAKESKKSESNDDTGTLWEKCNNHLFAPNIDYILQELESLLHKSPSKDLLASQIRLLSTIAPIVSGSSQIESLLEVSAFLLKQPSHRVNPKSKGDMLLTIQYFIPIYDLQRNESLRQVLFATISSLFAYFKDVPNRLILSEVLNVLAQQDIELQEVAKLCSGLNSFSHNSLNVPNFEERLQSFKVINEIRYRDFSLKQWSPLVYNMLYYIRDDEELAIRASASYALRRFIETNRWPVGSVASTTSDLLKDDLLPSLRRGVYEQSELVRFEYVTIMAHLVRHNPAWPEVSDMSVLLVNDDEEASFFTNILHIQQHRRLRSLRRLANEARQGRLRSSNIAFFFLPLIEHFVFDKADDEGAHNLSAETVVTIGVLSEWLEWPQFRATFRRINAHIQGKPELEKTIVKLLGVMIDSLARASRKSHLVLGEHLQPPGGDSDRDIQPENQMRSTLGQTMPKNDRLSEEIVKSLLPSLSDYLHKKDDSLVSLRVPMATSAAKLLMLLPEERISERLPSILTDVCHILRSRAQESRDLTRKTLVEISCLIGPQYFGFILRELRGSLARGYQLHVLSYTVHAILVATAESFKPGNLNYCLPQVVAIIMDDIFGVTGQEKEAEEYVSAMKEVKSSKSYDSMELVAKTASVTHLVHLIKPIQALLDENLDLKMVKKLDELLRRIGVGLLRNEAAGGQQILMFCFEVIQDCYKSRDSKKAGSSSADYKTKRFLLTLQKNNKTGVRGSDSSYKYKLCRFALDVLRSVLHKHDHLKTAANLSGFMPVIGDALLEAQEETQMSALRLITSIIKVPLKRIEENAIVYISEAVKIVKNSISTNSELSQAALKLISAVLRERRNVPIKDSDVAYLLARLKPDLDEPDRQGVTFGFLKAIMSRTIMVPEVYEVSDSVAAMMVMNQTRGARDLARTVYFQFLMEYPQGKDRLSKQLEFLVKNLTYKHPEGRQSVMEAVHLLLTKVGDDLVQQIVSTFFLPLAMDLINDESTECRTMASALLKELFERADAAQTKGFEKLLGMWLGQDDQPLLIRLALHIYGVYLDVHSVKVEKELPVLQARLTHLLEANIHSIPNGDWEVLYLALQMIAKLCQILPLKLLAASATSLWSSIRLALSFPHAWVRLAAGRLVGIHFSDFARANSGSTYKQRPLKGSYGLILQDEEIVPLAKASLGALRAPVVSEELATQTVRNLAFLGRFVSDLPIIADHDSQKKDGDLGTDEEEEEELEPESPEELNNSHDKTLLQYMLERCSVILRRETPTTKAPSLVPKTAALQLMATLCNHIPSADVLPHVPTILLPLHNLTDPSIPTPYSSDEAFRTSYSALVSSSHELMSLLQKKLGTTEYVKQLSSVREGVKGRREGRRVKRRLEAVAAPEKRAEEKKRKGERKREKRKERSGEARGRRRGW